MGRRNRGRRPRRRPLDRSHPLPAARPHRHRLRRCARPARATSRSTRAAAPPTSPPPCVFPDNVELEAVLTFAGDLPGPLLPEVAPDPRSLTLVQHHSLIRLPPPGYKVREDDPRLGAISLCFADFARGLDQTLDPLPGDPFPARKNRPHGRPLAGQEADRLLHRRRRARADPQRPGRRRQLVGHGLRRAPGFIDGFKVEVLPRRQGPARRALERGAVGAPLDPRLVLRRGRGRPAHRRGAQGPRAARLAADPPGPPALRRPAGHRRHRQRRARTIRSRWPSPASASWPPTRSATPSAWPTTSPPRTYAGRASVMDYPAPLIGDRRRRQARLLAGLRRSAPAPGTCFAIDRPLPPAAARRRRKGQELAAIAARGLAARSALPGRRRRPAGRRRRRPRQPVGQRRRPGRRAAPGDAGAGHRPAKLLGEKRACRAPRWPSCARCSPRSTCTTATSSTPWSSWSAASNTTMPNAATAFSPPGWSTAGGSARRSPPCSRRSTRPVLDIPETALQLLAPAPVAAAAARGDAGLERPSPPSTAWAPPPPPPAW